MTMDISHLLPYALPPLVGAFIGYVTNDIAIRMLFRPLKPWRLLGVRIPLTPGVLPAKRAEFAARIGRMVGSHLLTSEDVGRALEKEAFRRELKGAVTEKLDHLLDQKLGTVESLFPADFQGWVRDMVDQLRRNGIRELFLYLESPACEKEVRRFLRQKGDELLARDLHSFIPPDQYDALRVHVRKGIRDLLRSEQVGSTLAAFIDRKVEELFGADVTLRELVPASLAETLKSRSEQEIAAVLEGLLQDPDFMALVKDKMHGAFKGALGSLEGVSGFLAKLVDPDWLLSLFPEFQEKIEQEITIWLRDEATRRHIAQAVTRSIDLFLDQPLAGLLETIPYRRAAALRRLARKKALRLARAPQTVELLLSVIEINVERLRERTLDSVLTETLSGKGLAEVREAVADEVLVTLRSPAAREAFDRTLTEKTDEWLFRRPIGRLSTLIPATAKDELTGMIYQQLAELLVKEVPPLIETLNVQLIVEEKVNSLDILKMERLLLDIMEEHFMYINLFGALLGFLIGTLNVVVSGFAG